jgi:N-acetylglutamate synthase-like GNAT family acetyltransferase
MVIRNATYHDAPAIKMLLRTMGYTTTVSVIINQLEVLFGKNDHQVLVYELRREVVGFISLHFLPQLTFDKGLLLITSLSLDENVKEQGIAKALEQHVTELAIKKKCDRIQVHFMDWNAPDRAFYKLQGYQEYPNCYTKKLVYAE